MQSHPSPVSALPVLLIFLLPMAAYPFGYLWARSTHRLVRLSSGAIVPSDLSVCSDVTLESIVFEPATWAEEHIRSAFSVVTTS